MQFEYDGYKYKIEFQRNYKMVRVGVDKQTPPNDLFQASRHPYTTVILWKHEKDRTSFTLHRTATVGCWHKEGRFTLEVGRLRALKAISRTLSDGLKKAMWASYMNRERKPHVAPNGHC